MQIIGISAKKQGGKTTAMNHLVDQLGELNVLVVCFADFLKNIVTRCFGATHGQVDGTDKDKNSPLPCGKTAREVMQIVGTDWFRSLEPDCWINSYKWVLENTTTPLIITPDVRFPNEVALIQRMGGHVIRLMRAPFDESDQHESETALDTVEANTMAFECGGDYVEHEQFFDAIIDNREMSIEEQNQAVWKLITERGWAKISRGPRPVHEAVAVPPPGCNLSGKLQGETQ